MNNILLFREKDIEKLPNKENNFFLIRNYHHFENSKKNFKDINKLNNSFLEKKKEDVEKFSKQSFPKLVKYLNEYHDKNYKSRFWGILLGTWYERFVNIFYNRYYNILFAKDNFNIDEVFINKEKDISFEMKGTKEIEYFSNDLNWNFNFYLYLVHNSDIDFKKINYVNFEKKNINFINPIKERYSFNLKKVLFNLINNKKEVNTLALGTDLKLIDEIKLNFLLNKKLIYIFLDQLEEKAISLKIDYELRSSKLRKFDFKNQLDKCFFNILINCLPTIYMEGLSLNLKKIKELNLPKKVKKIFTSYGYDIYDLLKLWIANQVNLGSKYIVAQHGSIFARDFRKNLIYEYFDKFLVWGEERKNKDLTLFNTKIIYRKKINYKKNGGILIVSRAMRNECEIYNATSDYFSLFFSYVGLIDKIQKNITKDITFRFRNFKYELISHEHEYLKKRFPYLKFDFGKKKLQHQLSKFRICLFNYNSTGFSENISMNFPTIGYWPNFNVHSDSTFYDINESLIKEKIWFKNEDILVREVKNIWNDLDKWWESPNLIKTKQNIIKKYSLMPPKTKKLSQFIEILDKC